MSGQKPASEQSFDRKALAAAAIFGSVCCLGPLVLAALGFGAWFGLR